MKKSILMVAAILFVSIAFGQSEKYLNAMKQNIAQTDSIMQKGNAVELANNFNRIGDAEKDKWLPYYYAAYCTITQAFSDQDNSKKDAIADKATGYLTKAEEILGKSPMSIRMLKFAMNLTDDGMVGQQVFAGEATRLAYMTEEAKEGRNAFLEKRKPDFGDNNWIS